MQRNTLKLDSVALVAVAFVTVAAFSTISAAPRFGLSMMQVAVAGAQLARWVLYFGVYVIAINTIVRRDVKPVWKALETCILLFAGFGLIQSAFLPGFAQIVYPDSRDWVDWDVQGHRLVSTILDPNYAGAFIMLGLLVEVALIAMGERVARWKPLLLVAALLATASRGSILATIIGLTLVVLVRGRSKKLMSLFGVFTVGLVVALPKIIEYAASFNKLRVDDPSAMGRLISWARALEVFSDHPIIGIGYNTWSAIQTQYGWEQVAGAVFGLDGGLLFIAVLTGVVGLSLYILMFVLACRRAWHIWRNPEQSAFDRGMAIGIAAFSIALVIHSLFVNSLLLPFLMEPLWVLWAIGFAIRKPEIAVATAERRVLAA